jgi:3,4-dihydroxy-9,10-secoandrosta-1,3,5(10)-triene-9,17-dione 4,5-dioxygenase
MAKIEALGYVVAEATDVSKWKQFAEQTLGAKASPTPEGGLDIKIDERAYRIAIVKGTQDRFYASGWEVPDEASFNSVLESLKKDGVKVEVGNPKLRAARAVNNIATFTDPSGNRHELYWGVNSGSQPFKSPICVSGFKTGKQGMGHVVLPAAQNFDATLKFFRGTLFFGMSDIFNFKPAPEAPNMRIYFMHAAAGRHHSVALAEMPHPSGCVHIMLEVNSMTDVGMALDRVTKQGVKIMATLGQHENDKMTSFYMLTPGNFALEYGWGGLTIDPQRWNTTETKQVSIWGHDFSVGFR